MVKCLGLEQEMPTELGRVVGLAIRSHGVTPAKVPKNSVWHACLPTVWEV